MFHGPSVCAWQAEFALSAVDFLHRIGRTARAGQSGRVTSLYSRANEDLVQAVRSALEAGAPVVRAPGLQLPPASPFAAPLHLALQAPYIPTHDDSALPLGSSSS